MEEEKRYHQVFKKIDENDLYECIGNYYGTMGDVIKETVKREYGKHR